jgi:hypothetical protein
MDRHQQYRRMYEAQTAAAREYAVGMQDQQTSYFTDLAQVRANAENQWRSACETYVQELRAASAGDDAPQRATVAYRNLQREYARISDEYVKACEERYGRMADELRTAYTGVRTRVIDGWIDYLRELRQPDGPPPASATGKRAQS